MGLTPATSDEEGGDMAATEEREKVSIEEAIDEVELVDGELISDVTGVGQKAVERYLLRYEYGVRAKDIAEKCEITPQTVSNQVNGVRKKVLKYPRLAWTIGKFRARRANLLGPSLSDGDRTEGSVAITDTDIQYESEFRVGNAGQPYSWMYAVSGQFEYSGYEFHLKADYLIDNTSGVFIKRKQGGVSNETWDRPPVYSKYQYTIYPLPNVQIQPTDGGSLKKATEVQLRDDIASYVSTVHEAGTQFIRYAELQREGEQEDYHAQRTRPDDLLYRVSRTEGEVATEKYHQSRFIRDNIERVLRLYPFENPLDLPDETLILLWNGHPNGRGRAPARYNLKMYFDEMCVGIHASHQGRKRLGPSNSERTTLWGEHRYL